MCCPYILGRCKSGIFYAAATVGLPSNQPQMCQNCTPAAACVTHCRGKRIVPEPAERAHELAHERPIIHAADCDEHAQRRKRQPQDCPAPVRQLRYHTGDIYAADKAHGKRRRGNGGSGHHNAPCSKQDEKQYRSYRRKAEPDNDKRLACGLFLRLRPFRRTGRQAPSDRRALRRSPPRSSRRP